MPEMFPLSEGSLWTQVTLDPRILEKPPEFIKLKLFSEVKSRKYRMFLIAVRPPLLCRHPGRKSSIMPVKSLPGPKTVWIVFYNINILWMGMASRGAEPFV